MDPDLPHPAADSPKPADGEVTRLLAALPDGGESVADRLYGLVYDELRRIAKREMRGERADHTLATTDVVHEAYLRLAGGERREWAGRAHFLAVAATAMRRLLIDHARRRNARKRGGAFVPPDAADEASEDTDPLLIDLDDALRRLETVRPRLARVVECRFFAGMSIDETARALAIAPATVKRDWLLARAWLHRELDR